MQTFELNGKTYKVESTDSITTVAVVIKKNGEADKRFKPARFNTDSVAHLLGDAETEQLVIQFDETATPTATDGSNKYVQILQNGLKVGMSARAVTTLLTAVNAIMREDDMPLEPQSLATSRQGYNGTTHYYRLGDYRIQLTVITLKGFVAYFKINIISGNVADFAVTTHLMNVVTADLDNFVADPTQVATVVLVDDHPITKKVEDAPFYKDALEQALYYADCGELPEYAWFEDSNDYAVFIGNCVLVDGLDESTAVGLVESLQGELYENLTIHDNDSIIFEYVRNSLFNDYEEEKAIKLYGNLPFEELVKAAFTTYSTSIRLVGVRHKTNPELLHFHSFSKHLDMLLERGETSHSGEEFYTVSSYQGKQVIVCQKPFPYSDNDASPCLIALALMDGKAYAAQWSVESNDISEIEHMQQL